tara:strand:- start:127 stop:636 length:510 start_codon:yes stop_codon:yes gene_type:complete
MFKNKIKFKIIFLFSLFGIICNPIYAQIAGIERRFGTSNTNNFSYQIESTIGTRTNATVSGNILAETDAILNLKSGSKISNKIGDENGNASAVFIATPNGANVDLSGITGENLFMIEDGTRFKSSLRMKDNIHENVQSIGEASSFAIQNTRVTVQKTNSTLINSFQQAF